MTRDEAVATAEEYIAREGLSVGPVRAVYYSTGAEYDPSARPPPHWAVHFAYNGPPVEELPDMDPEPGLDTVVVVDDASGAARLVVWL